MKFRLPKTLLIMLGIGLAGSLNAATITKANNTDDLSLGSSWTGGTAPGSGDIAQFDTSIIGTGNNTYDFTSSLTWQTIRVDRATATAGGTETIGSSNGSTLTLTASRALADIGTANNFATQSAILLSSGTGASLVVNSAIVLAPSANSASLITSSRALTINGTINQGANTLDFNIAGSTTKLAGAITGSGAINKVGSSTLELLGDNTGYTGAFNNKAGSTVVGLNGLVNASSVTLSASGSFILGTAGTTRINNLSGVGNAIIRSDYTFTGGSVGAKILTVNQSVDGTFAGTFAEGTSGRTIAIVKEGSGNLTLSGAGTRYTAGTTVNAGTLTAGSLTAFGGGAITVNGGTLNLNGLDIANAITLAGGTLGNSGAAGTRTGDVALTAASSIGGSGDITLGGNITGNFGLTKVGSGTVTLNGASNAASGITVNAGTLKAGNATALGSGTVTVNGGTLDLNSQAIGNSITLSGGKLQGATGTYTGTVTATAGAAISGTYSSFSSGSNSLAAFDTTGGLSVGNLSGQGTFSGGLVTVSGSYTPGNSPGTQTFNSGLSLTGATTLEISADGSASDLINVTGGLTLGGGASLSLSLFGTPDYTTAFWDTNQTFTLINADSVSGSFASITTSGLNGDALEGSWSTAWVGNQFQATWTANAIPEPSSLGLLGVGMAGMLLRRRRKQA